MRPLLLCLALTVAVAPWLPAQTELVEDELPPILLASGREAQCRIVLTLRATEGERNAAEALREYLRKMCRADIPITTSGNRGAGTKLLIGGAAAVPLGRELSPRNLGPDGFILRSSGADTIAIAGATDASTLTAVYAFLEHLGCRFFMPGDIGEHIPRDRELTCAPLDRTEIPDFYHRVLWNNGNVAPTLTEQSGAEYAGWYRKNRLGGIPADHGHAYHRWLPEATYFPDHPEYFAEVVGGDGVARRTGGGQICTSNEDVIEIAAQAATKYFDENPDSLCFSLSSNDTGGFCECEACVAQDGAGPNGLSDRVLKFANAVAARVDEKHPGRLVAYYALYNNLPGPPSVAEPRSNVMPVMVNWSCHYHEILDDGCPQNSKWRSHLGKWHRISEQLFAYDYFQLSDLSTPISRIVGRNIRHYRDMGCLGFSGEILGRSQANNIALYIAARMLWDADQDPDALLEEFYALYYRSARQPMRAYHEALEEAARAQTDHRLGASWRMYTPELLERLYGYINLAREGARSRLIRRRVEMAALDLQATTLFVEAARLYEAWSASESGEGGEAALRAVGAAQEFLTAIADRDIVAEGIMQGRLSAMAADIEKAGPRPGVPDPEPEGPERPPDVGGTPAPVGDVEEATFGHLWDDHDDLGSLPLDGWMFRTDPRDRGEQDGWHDAGYDDSRWAMVSIGQHWETQRGEYDGVAWYRRQIEIPETAGGRDVYLWFGAVDESAWVYLDGKLIGEHDVGEAGWDQRFRVKLPSSVGPGRQVLAVKVLDRTLKGGIWKPIKLAAERVEE